MKTAHNFVFYPGHILNGRGKRDNLPQALCRFAGTPKCYKNRIKLLFEIYTTSFLGFHSSGNAIYYLYCGKSHPQNARTCSTLNFSLGEYTPNWANPLRMLYPSKYLVTMPFFVPNIAPNQNSLRSPASTHISTSCHGLNEPSEFVCFRYSENLS